MARQPLKGEVFDAVISIAVIHHLSTHQRRVQAVRELIRLTKRGGRILVLCWAFEQEKKFDTQDVFVEWNNQKKYENDSGKTVRDKQENDKKNTIVYKRYYHLFKQGELQQVIKEAAGENTVRITEEFYEHQNWGVAFQRL